MEKRIIDTPDGELDISDMIFPYHCPPGREDEFDHSDPFDDVESILKSRETPKKPKNGMPMALCFDDDDYEAPKKESWISKMIKVFCKKK